jgi:hypothetical protein
VKKINEVVVSLFFLLQMIVLSVEQPSFWWGLYLGSYFNYHILPKAICPYVLFEVFVMLFITCDI